MICPICDQGYYRCDGCGQRVCTGCPHRCTGGNVARSAAPVNAGKLAAAGVASRQKAVARPPIDGMARAMLGY